jgi:hypothetical protein
MNAAASVAAQQRKARWEHNNVTPLNSVMTAQQPIFNYCLVTPPGLTAQQPFSGKRRPAVTAV